MNKKQSTTLPKQKELEASNSDYLKTEENTELFTVEPIDNSPLKIISKDGRHFIALMNYKITDDFNDKTDCLNYTNSLDFIVRLIGVMIEINEHKNEIHKDLTGVPNTDLI